MHELMTAVTTSKDYQFGSHEADWWFLLAAWGLVISCGVISKLADSIRRRK